MWESPAWAVVMRKVRRRALVPFELDAQESKHLVGAVREGVWRVSSEGVVLVMNGSMARLLEIESPTIQANVLDLVQCPGGALRKGTFECELLTASGLSRRVRVNSIATPAGFFQVLTDITAEHTIQARLVDEAQRMARLAGQDPLTSLPNRRAFDIVLYEAVQSASAHPFGVLMVDLDDFKSINDLYGHSTGDRALTEFADALAKSVRSSDFLARIGGDEFGIVCTGVDKTRFAEIQARLQKTVDQSAVDSGFALSCSIGGAHSSDGVEAVLARADQDMYHHKRSRKVFQPRLAVSDIAKMEQGLGE